MAEIVMPRLNSNDETLELVEWLVEEAAWVEPGQVVAVVETSKAAGEVEAADEGVIERAAAARSRLAPGEVIARVHADRQTYEKALADRSAANAAGAAGTAADGPVLTDAARELVHEHGITAEALAGLRKRLIRASDLSPLIESAGDRTARHQDEVARAVSRSHAEIPDATVTMKMDATPLSAAIEAMAESGSARIGMAEFIIKALAATRDSFPAFFARTEPGAEHAVAAGVQVAVTVDAGSGLYLPVLRDADTATVVELGRQLLVFTVKAVKREFEVADFVGANFAVSLHLEPGVVHAVPVIPHGLVAAATLCGPTDELALDDAGQVCSRRIVHVGLTYDHRFVNGREAMRLLAELRGLLQSPGYLSELADAAAELGH